MTKLLGKNLRFPSSAKRLDFSVTIPDMQVTKIPHHLIMTIGSNNELC